MRSYNQSNQSPSYCKTSFEKNLNFIDDDVCVLINKKADPINHIVFATDLSDRSYKAFLPVLNIAKANNYVINFLYINPTSKTRLFTENFKSELKRFTNICSRKTCGVIWETSISKTAKGIEEVVEQFGGELVVVAYKNGSSINLSKMYLSDFVFLSKDVELISY